MSRDPRLSLALWGALWAAGCTAEAVRPGADIGPSRDGARVGDQRAGDALDGPDAALADGATDPCVAARKLTVVDARDEGHAEAGHEIARALDGLGAGDGDPDARWALRPMPTDVVFDLGVPQQLCRARFSFYRFDEGRSYRYRVETSLDGEAWNEAASLAASALAEWNEVALEGRSARYLRLHFASATPATEWAGLWEVEIWGAGPDPGVDGGLPPDSGPDAGPDAGSSADLSNGQVILRVDFDDHPAGEYTAAQIDADWGTVQWSSTGSPNRAYLVEGADAYAGRSLRILYPEGGVGPGEGGAQWRVTLPDSYDELQVSYRVKFVTGVDFRLGGKLPGFCGGACYTGGNNGLDGWSARLMWVEGGEVIQYVYWPGNTGWGDGVAWDQGGQRAFVPGQWHQVRTRIVINTAGQANGVLQSWFDGQLALDRSDMTWRVTAHPDVVIDQFYFSTFYGASGDQYAPDHDAYVYFDDFVITRP